MRTRFFLTATMPRWAVRRDEGISLLLTLVVMVALVVIVAVIARLVMADKRITRGYSEIARAEMAAGAAQADAQQLLLNFFTKYPDSVTYWDPAMGSSKTPGTVFAYRDVPADKVFQGGNPAAQIFFRPLVSGATTQQMPDIAKALTPDDTNLKKSVDINSVTFGEDAKNGWVGKLPADPNPTPIRVPWINILGDDAKPTARYAFWIEDESFRLNVNTAKAAQRGDEYSERDEQDKAKTHPQPSLQGLFLNDSAPDPAVAQSVEATRDTLTVIEKKFLSPSQIGHSPTLPAGMKADEFANAYRFLLTTDSSGLDLSRSGFKRFNPNEAVEHSIKDLPNIAYGEKVEGPDLKGGEDKAKIAVDQIEAAIKANAPSFGQRFYRTGNTKPAPSNYKSAPLRNASEVTAADADRYLQKVAVNIYDYISPARNPLMIDRNGKVFPYRPFFTLADADLNLDVVEQENPIRAMGKEAAPYITEWLMHAKILKTDKVNPPPDDGSPDVKATFHLEIDHYVEFWNMTGKDLVPADGDLGPGPILVLEHQPRISADDTEKTPRYDVPVGRAFEIKLDGSFLNSSGERTPLRFKAGEVTVITTDQNWSVNAVNMNIVGKNLFVATELYLPGGAIRADQGVSISPHAEETWESGSDGAMRVTNSMPNVRRFDAEALYYDENNKAKPEVQMGPDWSKGPEMETLPGVLIANRFGLISAQPFLRMRTPDKNNLIAFRDEDARADITLNNFRGAYLYSTYLGLKDPRAALEASTLDRSNPNCSALDTSTTSYPKATPEPLQSSSLGAFFNAKATDKNPNFWETDCTVFTEGASYAPMVVANAPMRSIAELGNIYDPMRISPAPGVPLSKYRGGGKTLTIGQPDVLWDGTRSSTAGEAELSFQTSASREWAAWRLTDIFTVRTDDDRRDEAKTTVEGLYNPNGILRDKGLVLRALVEGLKFTSDPASDSNLMGKTLNSTATEKATAGVTSALTQSVAAGGPALARYLSQRLDRSIASADRRFSPLWEPGELSQLQLFSPYNLTGATEEQIASGAKTAKLNDRGREEFFRRLSELITTRGNTYAIYVVGQSLDKQGKPIAKSAQRVVIRLTPVWDPVLNEDFQPADANLRFRRPERWKVEVLSKESA